MSKDLIKKIAFAFGLIIIGALFGYFISKFQKDIPPILITQKGQWKHYKTQSELSEIRNMLDKFVKDSTGNYYHTRPNNTGHRRLLRGFWIEKNMLDTINSYIEKDYPTDSLVGYHVLFGKIDNKGVIEYKLVVRGSVTSKTKNNQLITSAGDYFDMVDPCPDNCGTNY